MRPFFLTGPKLEGRDMDKALAWGFASFQRFSLRANAATFLSVAPSLSTYYRRRKFWQALRFESTTVSFAGGKSKTQYRKSEVWPGTTSDWRQNTEIVENLQLINTSMGMEDYGHTKNITVIGKVVTWGIDSEWTLKWNLDGSFYERFENEEFTHEWGHDGKTTWQTDAAGRILILELDDREVCILCTWIRTGFWVTEKAEKRLDIQQELPGFNGVLFSPEHEMVFSVRIKDKEVVACVVIDRNTWLPVRMSFQRFCFRDRWKFSNWQTILPDCQCRLPIFSSRFSSSVGQESFKVVKVNASNAEDCEISDVAFSYPSTLLVPRKHQHRLHAEIDTNRPASIQMKYAKSGHYVVRPIVDGKEGGYFIIDTGTGCLAINRKKAMQLGMHSFGEVYATSISGGGMMRTQFFRGRTFQLGRLKITNPLFMEINVDKLLNDVDGLCGFDIFHGFIVEMSPKHRTFSLFEPSEYGALARTKNLRWQRMFLFDNVPHVFARVNGSDVMLMLDSGAAGANLMFPNNVVEGFDDPQVDASTTFRGKRMVVTEGEYGNVGKFEIAGYTFTDVIGLVPSKSAQKMGLSGYVAGIFCAEMLQHFMLVFDYANRRMALIDQRPKRQNVK